MTSIHVGNLDTSVISWDLYKTFLEAGPIVATTVCRDWKTRESLGYGYVNFQDCEVAEWVMKYRRTWTLKGRRLKISWSLHDPPEPKTMEDEEEKDRALLEEIGNKPVFPTKYVKMYIQYQEDLAKKLAMLNSTDNTGDKKEASPPKKTYITYAAACRGEPQETEADKETPKSPPEATEERRQPSTKEEIVAAKPLTEATTTTAPKEGKAAKKRAAKARKAAQQHLTEATTPASNPPTQEERAAAEPSTKEETVAAQPSTKEETVAAEPSTKEETVAAEPSRKEENVAVKLLAEETTAAPEPSPRERKAAKKRAARARKTAQKHLAEAKDEASNPTEEERTATDSAPEEGTAAPTTPAAEMKELMEKKKKKGFFSRIRRGLARAARTIRNVFRRSSAK